MTIKDIVTNRLYTIRKSSINYMCHSKNEESEFKYVVVLHNEVIISVNKKTYDKVKGWYEDE